MSDIRYNPKNEKVKETFLEMFEEAKGRDSKTVRIYANAIREFEIFTNFKDFKTFNTKQAIGFKDYLGSKKNKRTGKSISKSYLRYATYVKNFFEWLERQKGYQKHINYNDVQYFSLTRNDRNKALATSYQESYEISEILSTIRKMPTNTLIETKFDARQMRDKAMISLNLLTTPRISALQSATVGSIKYFKNQDSWAFIQNPNFVNTKNSNNITAYFIGSLQDIYKAVFDWIDYLKSQEFADEDPLFPRFKASFTSEGLKTLILEKNIIKSQTTIRKIFENAFKNNDLHYLKPHTFRHAITRKANELSNSSRWISALNQNFGHKLDSVILSSYGTIAENKRGMILKDFELE